MKTFKITDLDFTRGGSDVHAPGVWTANIRDLPATYSSKFIIDREDGTSYTAHIYAFDDDDTTVITDDDGIQILESGVSY